MEFKETDFPNGLYGQLCANDMVATLKPILGDFTFDVDAEKFRLIRATTHLGGPWVHTRAPKGRRCYYWHGLFTKCGILHPGCAERCWKVVVKPRTVKELFCLLSIQENVFDQIPNKCGIEMRSFVHGLYGGYFYCDTLEEGKEVHGLVRKAVDRAMAPGVSVILKQGCTEMEAKKGPGFKCKNRDRQVSKWFDDNFFIPEFPGQPTFAKVHVMRGWLEFAWDNGDETAVEFNDGEPYMSSYKTYHEGEDDGKGEGKDNQEEKGCA